jgi:hypothetical protein
MRDAKIMQVYEGPSAPTGARSVRTEAIENVASQDRGPGRDLRNETFY